MSKAKENKVSLRVNELYDFIHYMFDTTSSYYTIVYNYVHSNNTQRKPTYI